METEKRTSAPANIRNQIKNLTSTFHIPILVQHFFSCGRRQRQYQLSSTGTLFLLRLKQTRPRQVKHAKPATYLLFAVLCSPFAFSLLAVTSCPHSAMRMEWQRKNRLSSVTAVRTPRDI